MIRMESEYRAALKQREQNRATAEKQQIELAALGLTSDQIGVAMEPLLCFYEQLNDEIAWYENAKRRCFPPITSLSYIGNLLIGLRIANGVSQKQLAERLDVNPSAISRDEQNGYFNITIERAQKILDALEEQVTVVAECAHESSAGGELSPTVDISH